jgi:ZIP family zinc transporter
MVATISGVLIMWALVAYLHSGDSHAHGSGQEIHQEDEHGHEEGHAEEGHAEEGHAEEDGHQHSENE